jgi:hypothetical protein
MGAFVRRNTARLLLRGTSVAQICGHRFADVDRQRETIPTRALAADDDLTGAPVNVVGFEASDFTAAKAEP